MEDWSSPELKIILLIPKCRNWDIKIENDIFTTFWYETNTRKLSITLKENEFQHLARHVIYKRHFEKKGQSCFHQPVEFICVCGIVYENVKESWPMDMGRIQG